MILENIQVCEKNDIFIHSPFDIIPHLKDFSDFPREHFTVIALSAKFKVISIRTLFIGISNRCLVRQREVFTSLVKDEADAFIIVHNHPSGDTTPSPEDVELTQSFIEASKIMGLQLLDHIVISANCNSYFSFLENDLCFKEIKKASWFMQLELFDFDEGAEKKEERPEEKRPQLFFLYATFGYPKDFLFYSEKEEKILQSVLFTSFSDFESRMIKEHFTQKEIKSLFERVQKEKKVIYKNNDLFF